MNSYRIADIHAALEELDQVFAELQEAFVARDWDMNRLKRMLERGHHQHLAITSGNIFTAVAVMYIEIHQRHAGDAVMSLSVANANGDVIENTKSHRGVAFSMVDRWAHRTESTAHFTGNDQVCGEHGGAGSVRCCDERIRIHTGIRIELCAACRRYEYLHLSDTVCGMRALQLFPSGFWCQVARHQVKVAVRH